MIIDSLTTMEVFIEMKSLLRIVGNSSVNSTGTLEIDSNNNSLISEIDSGDTPLYRLSVYNGKNGLMLYNPTTKYLQIANEGDFLNVDIDFERGTKYYIGSKLIKSVSVNRENSSFEVPLDGLNIFKIFMDGRELKSHSTKNNTITIYGNDRLLIDDFSELVVYAYETTNITSEDNIFEIEYYQYETVWNKDTFLDGSYFEEIKGIYVNCFESTSINQSVTKTMYRGRFKYATESRINSIDNTADFSVFSASEFIDMVQYIGTNEFRMIFANSSMGRYVLLNNCRNTNGTSLILEKSKNTKKFNLSCGNYIDIEMSSSSKYGEGRYGRKLYGSNIWVINSHRKGE
ncbi:MAG: hypothetical protein ACRC1T_09205 [Clostridium chrysemydis]|uniref:hypothetical protein n=1 Tax=Clostridium chrysemydis TaxID=2665504 RepID=UPI003F3557D5